ncbi:MAG: hypothetical protein MN733_06550 [Nitrososphaera sp.]|nr:hypothetical protein [Nitrososphaera sp.]
MTTADFDITNDRSIMVFTPLTEAAKDWVEKNVHLEDWQRLGKGFGVDYRFAGNLIDGIICDGLTVE